ncbi:MAG: type II toxin-antitoxin system YafQ family toxin [Candidatus Symbiothrix sp.]|nr:type II toxin-antitoxin system YafQ family toxin [Candidatus Symbiothrix sp.]
MYKSHFTGKFKRDVKLCLKRNYDMNLLNEAMKFLLENGYLPPEYLPHPLKGTNYVDWECHIKPDWLMIWYVSDDEITFVRTGTHSDLFK